MISAVSFYSGIRSRKPIAAHENGEGRVDRRDFLKTAAAAGAGLAVPT
jgi:hypothetical protein